MEQSLNSFSRNDKIHLINFNFPGWIRMRFNGRRIELSPYQTITLGLAAIILIGAVVLSLPFSSATGHSIGFLNALFTATSAVTVTGLGVLDTGTDFSLFGQSFILLLIQIGGLGFTTFGVIIAIILGKKIGLKQRLFISISTGQHNLQGLVRLVLTILTMTVAFELIGFIVLTLRWIGEMGWSKATYYSLFHTVAAFNNSGFSLWSDSLTGYVSDPVVNIVITALIILGSIGFIVITDVWNKRNWRQLSLHSKIVLITTGALLSFGFLFFLVVEWGNAKTMGPLSIGSRLWSAWFQAVTGRTTGFNTLDIAGMYGASQFVLILLMFIGGSSGSAAGGIKTNTFAILLIALYNIVKGREDVQAFERRISIELVLRALAVVTIAIAMVVGVTLLLTITERLPSSQFLEALFEAASAFSTTGLTIGLTTQLSPIGKVIIILTMFIGKLGPLTIAFALAQKKKKATNLRYPEEKVLIG
jgi:trk system potassium uptake protein TrkH